MSGEEQPVIGLFNGNINDHFELKAFAKEDKNIFSILMMDKMAVKCEMQSIDQIKQIMTVCIMLHATVFIR